MTNVRPGKSLPASLKYDLCRTALAALLLALTAVVPLPVAVKSIFALLAIIVLLLHKHSPREYTNLEDFMVCFAVAIGIIGVCSKSSFLYPLNDWVDANCFFTVGKSMMNGIVLYRDLLEQKGPFLYFLHGLAWLISGDTFIGVYFLEVLAATFFLYFSYRIITLFVQSDFSILAIPVCAVLIYTSASFCDGDSVEELFLPFLAYALWIGFDAICSKRDITKLEYFIVGLTSGLIFWSKCTVVGLYIGWYLYFAVQYLYSRKWKNLFQSILLIICGVAVATIPFVIYFGVHGAIADWLTVYLYNNFFLYSTGDESLSSVWRVIRNILGGVYITIGTNPQIPIMCIIALVYFVRHKMASALFLVATAASLLAFAFMGSVYHHYYSFSVNLFLPLGSIPFLNLLASVKEKKGFDILKKRIIPVALALSIVAACLLTPNRYLMGVSKEELPQYKFASIIGTDGSATLLNYGFLDGGFHTTTNTLPQCKAFCLLCIIPDTLMEMQDACIENGSIEYVVTRGEELTHRNYTCISTCEFIWNGSNVVYYLYQRV